MDYSSYASLIGDLAEKFGNAGILDDKVYVSLFQEIRQIRKNIQKDKSFVQDRNVGVVEKYNRVQRHNAMLSDYLTKLIRGLDSTADQPGSLLAPIGRIIERMNNVIPKYVEGSSSFGANYIADVAYGARNSYSVMSRISFFIIDLIDGVFHSNGYVSVLLNETLIALSELQGMNNEVIMQVFEEFQATKEKLKSTEEQLRDAKEQLRDTREQLKDAKEQLKDTKEQLRDTKEQLRDTKEQLNKMHEDLEYIKDQLGLSRSGSKQQSMVDFYISGP